MEKLEFRPTKVLLVFWVIRVLMACLPIGGMVTGLCADFDIPWQYAFAGGYMVPLVLLTTYSCLYFHTIRYEIDDRYVSKASGILWKRRRSIPLEKITNIDVRQGPVERIFEYGKILIFTPSTGASTPEEKLVGIMNPHEVKQIIVDRSEAEQQPKPSSAQEVQESSGEVVALLSDIRDSLKNIEHTLSPQTEESLPEQLPKGTEQ